MQDGEVWNLMKECKQEMMRDSFLAFFLHLLRRLLNVCTKNYHKLCLLKKTIFLLLLYEKFSSLAFPTFSFFLFNIKLIKDFFLLNEEEFFLTLIPFCCGFRELGVNDHSYCPLLMLDINALRIEQILKSMEPITCRSLMISMI